MRFKDSYCNETQKLKLGCNSKTQIVMKPKNSNCNETQTQIVMKLKNSNCDENQIVMKLRNLNCDKS